MLRVLSIVPSGDEAVGTSLASRSVAASGDLTTVLRTDSPTFQDGWAGVITPDQAPGDSASEEHNYGERDATGATHAVDCASSSPIR